MRWVSEADRNHSVETEIGFIRSKPSVRLNCGSNVQSIPKSWHLLFYASLFYFFWCHFSDVLKFQRTHVTNGYTFKSVFDPITIYGVWDVSLFLYGHFLLFLMISRRQRPVSWIDSIRKIMKIFKQWKQKPYERSHFFNAKKNSNYLSFLCIKLHRQSLCHNSCSEIIDDKVI